MTRLEELEEILEKVCDQYEADCSKCPKRKECNEYIELSEENKRRNHSEDYRVQVFYNNASDNYYFDDRDEAVMFGTKQSSKLYVTAVFLLRHVVDGKYDVEMEIK